MVGRTLACPCLHNVSSLLGYRCPGSHSGRIRPHVELPIGTCCGISYESCDVRAATPAPECHFDFWGLWPRCHVGCIRCRSPELEHHFGVDCHSFEREGRGPVSDAHTARCEALRMGVRGCVRGYCSRFSFDTVQICVTSVGSAVCDSRPSNCNVTAIRKQTPGRTAGKLAAYRRSAAAVALGIPAADLSPASFWATWQATKWPGAISRKGAISTLQMSSAAGQRGWKVQPGGGLMGDGTSPGRIMRWRLESGSTTGTAESSACV